MRRAYGWLVEDVEMPRIWGIGFWAGMITYVIPVMVRWFW